MNPTWSGSTYPERDFDPYLPDEWFPAYPRTSDHSQETVSANGSRVGAEEDPFFRDSAVDGAASQLPRVAAPAPNLAAPSRPTVNSDSDLPSWLENSEVEGRLAPLAPLPDLSAVENRNFQELQGHRLPFEGICDNDEANPSSFHQNANHDAPGSPRKDASSNGGASDTDSIGNFFVGTDFADLGFEGSAGGEEVSTPHGSSRAGFLDDDDADDVAEVREASNVFVAPSTPAPFAAPIPNLDPPNGPPVDLGDLETLSDAQTAYLDPPNGHPAELLGHDTPLNADETYLDQPNGYSPDLLGPITPREADGAASALPNLRVGFDAEPGQYAPLYEGRTKQDVLAQARQAYQESLRSDGPEYDEPEPFDDYGDSDHYARSYPDDDYGEVETNRERSAGLRLQRRGRLGEDDVLEEKSAKDRLVGGAIEFAFLIVPAVALVLLVRSFVVTPFFIPSESMVPTLEVDDRVLVNRLHYKVGDIERGDVVVVSLDKADGIGEREFVKRVIGLPGETVEIRNNTVIIDGVTALDESAYLEDNVINEDFLPYTVPDDEIFLLGDNRVVSDDSRRSLGPVHIDDVVGRAFVIFWPPSNVGSL